jgi:hypothetical protein
MDKTTRVFLLRECTNSSHLEYTLDTTAIIMTDRWPCFTPGGRCYSFQEQEMIRGGGGRELSLNSPRREDRSFKQGVGGYSRHDDLVITLYIEAKNSVK